MLAYETGQPALLVVLSGTLPVNFRGTTYRFPLSIWVPHAYPREAPIVYATPTGEIVVRPGQHVGGDGRCYHPYLANWAEFWSVSAFRLLSRAMYNRGLEKTLLPRKINLVGLRNGFALFFCVEGLSMGGCGY